MASTDIVDAAKADTDKVGAAIERGPAVNKHTIVRDKHSQLLPIITLEGHASSQGEGDIK